MHAYVYKHVYRDFTKKKSQYQDSIRSEAEEGNGDRPWEVLYDNITDSAASQPSEETSEAFSLMDNVKCCCYVWKPSWKSQAICLSEEVHYMAPLYKSLAWQDI